ncbi:MAG: hypothetical protein ABFQ95_02295 [Pseudomonadota bacterium]
MKNFWFCLAVFLAYAPVAQASDNDHRDEIPLKACGFIDHFIDFETDMLDSELINSMAEPAIEGNIRALEALKDKFTKISTGELTPQKLLDILLDLRFDFLNNRKTLVQAVRGNISLIQQGKCSQFTPYGPTKPSLYDTLGEEVQFLARQSTDRYQSLNQLILYAWEMVDPRTLPSQIKLKIRCSTTLFDLFSGRDDYLGHPDAAILEYDDEPLPDSLNTDCYNWQHHLEKHEVEITLLNWTKKVTKIQNTIYELSLWDEKRPFYGKIPELLYPEWLKPRPQTPSIQDTEVAITSPAPTQETKIDSAQAEAERKVNKQQEAIVPTPAPKTVSVESLRPRQRAKDNSSPEKAKPEITAQQPEPASQEIESPSLSSSPSPSPSPSPRLRPRGMRVFHKKQPALSFDGSNPYAELSGKHQKTADCIFNAKQFKKVTYANFKSLWRHVHGDQSVKESTGSSHKKLISTTGQVFGTFAHGDNMTYTHRTIKYLRDALTQTGYTRAESK